MDDPTERLPRYDPPTTPLRTLDRLRRRRTMRHGLADPDADAFESDRSARKPTPPRADPDPHPNAFDGHNAAYFAAPNTSPMGFPVANTLPRPAAPAPLRDATGAYAPSDESPDPRGGQHGGYRPAPQGRTAAADPDGGYALPTETPGAAYDPNRADPGATENLDSAHNPLGRYAPPGSPESARHPRGGYPAPSGSPEFTHDPHGTGDHSFVPETLDPYGAWSPAAGLSGGQRDSVGARGGAAEDSGQQPGVAEAGGGEAERVARGRHRKQAAHGMGGLGGILRDIALVTFGKYGQYVITLVTVPLLARTLGPHGTGLLAIGMSSYFIGSLLVDLGITQFLAARVHESELGRAEINRLRGSYLAIRLGTLAVIGATLLGSLAAGAAPPLHMVLLGLFAGGFWSVSEDWLLIGQGRFGSSTGYQGVGRIVYLVLLIVLLPHYPTATTAVLCLLISSAPTVGLTWWDSVRNYGPPAKPYGVRAMMRMAAPVFTSRMLVTGYGQGSAAVYSAVLDAASLGLYSAGDRLVRAIQSSLDPIGFALLPRMARRSTHDRFWRNSIQALVAVVTVATVASVSVWVLAPTLIHLIYSHDFDGAIGLLRLEVLILPATTITSYVTTAILPVKSDTMGVLIGAVIGTCIAGIALAYAVRTQSVWTLVHGTVSAEIGVALWYIIRVRWLIVRERSVRSGASGSDPATVLMGKGDPA